MQWDLLYPAEIGGVSWADSIQRARGTSVPTNPPAPFTPTATPTARITHTREGKKLLVVAHSREILERLEFGLWENWVYDCRKDNAAKLMPPPASPKLVGEYGILLESRHPKRVWREVPLPTPLYPVLAVYGQCGFLDGWCLPGLQGSPVSKGVYGAQGVHPRQNRFK